MESYNISIKAENYKRGLVYGEISDMEFIAFVNKEKSDEGINPENLRSGKGRVVKLCIFQDTIEEEGDPFKMVFKTSRYIYAEYNEKWEVLNVKYYDLIQYLTRYLDKRYAFRIIHGSEEEN